jgi:ankyrin repeat protein
MADFPKLPRCKQDDENMEKIHCAARRGQAELVRRLVSTGIDPSIHNKFGCTALHLGCKHGHPAVVRELAKGDLSIPWHGRRPLHLAVLSNNMDCVAALVDAAKGQGKAVETFMGENDDCEVVEVGGFRKHCQGQTPMHWCVGLQNIAMLKHMLNLGATPNSKDKNGETVLMRAIEFGLDDCFDILVESPQMRLETVDRNGKNALHYACIYNRPKMAARLIEMKVDVNAEDAEKLTPWLAAAYATMVGVLEAALQNVDSFALQNAPVHNGKDVLIDRFEWYPFAQDAHKGEVVKILQKKLDSILRDRAQKNLGKAPNAPIHVAPSAPVKK